MFSVVQVVLVLTLQATLNYLQSSVDTIQKDHIYHTKQYLTFYRKIKSDLLNLEG